MIQRLWRKLKVWRRIGIGPVSILFKFQRAVRVTRGVRKHRPLSRTPSLAARGNVDGIQVGRPELQALHFSTQPAESAVIVGVGPGFGYALARRLAREGFDLVLVSRDADRLSSLVAELHSYGIAVESYGADATDEVAVSALFERIETAHGTPSLVVYSVQDFGPGNATDVELPAFESAWRHNCLGAFLVSRQAARLMRVRGVGTILFVGSTSSLIGRAGHLNLAVGKFGQRAIAQVLARELWPQGIHVAHAVVDADIAEDEVPPSTIPQSDPADIAASILALHRQPRTAWTSELDLRPWNERFWEHC
jgi:NAD(P)-dependent dehydrogenase (short-subunit alcohol dehydrogenase family)